MNITLRKTESKFTPKPRESSVSNVKEGHESSFESFIFYNVLSTSFKASTFVVRISEFNKAMPFSYFSPSSNLPQLIALILILQNDNELIKLIEEEEH